MFELGGTAVDAGIAAGFALNVLLFDRADFGGVAPIVLYDTRRGKVVTLDGLGSWPAATDPNHFINAPDGEPEGILRTVTPGAVDSWLTALAEFGTLTASDVLEPAWDLAEHGAPISTTVARNLQTWMSHVEERYPTTLDAFYPGCRSPRTGEIFARPNLARVLKSMMDADSEARVRGLDRKLAIRAARDVVYRGWVADEIVHFHQKEGGWMTHEDLARHQVEVAPPQTVTHDGYKVHSCGFWGQGPVLLQCLNMLECFDFERFPRNSPDYWHLLIEVVDHAYADRENFYGDPRTVNVPAQGLLSKEYARSRAREIQPDGTRGVMPSPGDPWEYEPRGVARIKRTVDVSEYVDVIGPQSRIDTSYVAAADANGNFLSATPSDMCFWGPVIPSLGFACSGRGTQSRVDPEHPASIAPGKRPRLTPSPALVSIDGRPAIALGCPGGDIQPQGVLQVFLNLCRFGMNVQQAIEMPRLMSWNFPNSFAPHTYHPGRVDLEARVPTEIAEALRELGHQVRFTAEWTETASAVHVVARNLDDGVTVAGADPRCEGSALAW